MNESAAKFELPRPMFVEDVKVLGTGKCMGLARDMGKMLDWDGD